ncbi:precorrin-3B C(17)-methyltransferase [Thermosediminibacter oceani]|uniref:Precorrin-3 methyltransferase n=1 Tax=Thermosediminibacter oceani (strain ATCC BAA-1034 / DSM 16646 / JW/IW-1228P) TaxID=555079 RepID=D9S0T4_THEOJ|nr:precorrin-3B C(17)-methyltransferase [Thermosediminibacter oceani]ADL07098.1 precorrin-3 methyltransferase [Thermosediminibacter oceani DSM 16646]
MSWIKVVGIGPGSSEDLTFRAAKALKDSDVVVGYTTYINLIKPLIEGKMVIVSGMRDEVERCRKALELAGKGLKVSLVSGGDPGVYGMAGLLLEVALKGGAQTEIEVIPGVSAVNSAAAILGAPLMQDFAVVSLSDHLVPWEVIEKRLSLAAQADFVIAIYNPGSSERPENLSRAWEILMRHKKPDTPVGIVRKASREGQSVAITRLDKLPEYNVDMSTIVVVGGESTFISGRWIITPRGYRV